MEKQDDLEDQWVKYKIQYIPFPPNWIEYITTHIPLSMKGEEAKPLTIEEAKEKIRKDKASHNYYQKTYDYYKYKHKGTTWFERRKKGELAPTDDPTTRKY